MTLEMWNVCFEMKPYIDQTSLRTGMPFLDTGKLNFSNQRRMSAMR